MTGASLKRVVGTFASGRARATWQWKAAAATVPPLAAFVIQWYFLHPPMARWALFYPAVFIASWLGGLSSGLVATALASALVPAFFVPNVRAHLAVPPNLIAAIIFVGMGIATSFVHQRLRDIVAQLEQSRRLLQAIMDYSPNVIVIKDFIGRYLMVNRRLEEMLQVERGQATGKTDVALFPEASAQRHHETDTDVLAKREPITYEETLQLGETTRVFQTSKFPLHDAAGHAFAICAIWSDITDRKRMEESLRQSECDLRQAERVAHLGSWTWNVADNTARWSDELYRIFGLKPPPEKQNPAHTDVPPVTADSRSVMRNALQSVLEDGQPHEAELEITLPDGSTRWVLARGDAVRNARGEIVAVAGTAQDVTQLKELQRLREEWMSVIAHDLRQPIAVIISAASGLQEEHPSTMTKQATAYTSLISSAAKGLARLVDDLLDLSLLEAHRLQLDRHWLKPHSLVCDAIERMAHVTVGHRVTVSGEQDVRDVFVDAMRVGQVLGNLISNAAKYGDKESDIVVHIHQRGPEVEIAVTNHGRGISAEDLPRLFNRFTRASTARRSRAPGAGLGLYIAKELTEAHGGRIWVESTPGETTTFHLTLPCQAEAQKAA